MSRFSPWRLSTWTGGVWLPSQIPPSPAHGFSNSTRSLRPHDCFVALPTPRRDGHDFLHAALNAGAACALVSRPVPTCPLPQLLVTDTLTALHNIARHWRLFCRAPVIGVTGSAGKTSTTGMLLAMLGTTGFGTTANLNNLLGVPLTVLGIRPAAHTAGIVIEAGMSEPGELTLSAQIIQPDIALVTNVLPAHLTGLGNIAAIAHEKSELPRYARTGAAAVFPADCLRYPSFRNLPCHAFPVSFATETPENTTAAAPSKNATPLSAFFDEIPTGGYHITLRSNPATDIDFFMPPCTKGMAHNAALAAVTARLAGVPPARIRKTLLQWKPSALRGELRTHNGRLFYIDCYNANPASVLDAANTFDHLTRDSDTRLFVLAGMNEMGPHSANLHEETGRALPLRTGDTLLLFGGDSTSIGTGAIAAGFPPSSILSLPDITAVRTAIHSSHAPVFLKGSRSYALERTLPWTPMPPH